MFGILYSIWNEIINSCADLASTNAQDIRRQLEDAGVELIEGLASFPDSGGTKSMFVSTGTGNKSSVTTVNADKFLIASGSKPFRPSGIPFDGYRVFDSDSINQVCAKVCVVVSLVFVFSKARGILNDFGAMADTRRAPTG
jgi:pyruvate/2-oxoglutarate dehydrogenase complex dihydrolipoamide dehydrogenase (E3) component